MYTLPSHITRLTRQQIWSWFGGCRVQPFQKLPFNYTYIVHYVELKIPSTKDTFALTSTRQDLQWNISHQCRQIWSELLQTIQTTLQHVMLLLDFQVMSFCRANAWIIHGCVKESKSRLKLWPELQACLLRGRSREHHGQLTQAQILPWWQRNLRSTRLTLHQRLVLLWLYFAEHARGQNFMMQVEIDARLHTAVTVLLCLCWFETNAYYTGLYLTAACLVIVHNIKLWRDPRIWIGSTRLGFLEPYNLWVSWFRSRV